MRLPEYNSKGMWMVWAFVVGVVLHRELPTVAAVVTFPLTLLMIAVLVKDWRRSWREARYRRMERAWCEREARGEVRYFSVHERRGVTCPKCGKNDPECDAPKECPYG